MCASVCVCFPHIFFGGGNCYQFCKFFKALLFDIDPYVGNVTATADSTDGSKIRLVFNDSVAIDEISSLQFLVGSSSVATTWEYQTEFVPSQVSVSDGSVYYYFTLPNVKLTTPGNYYIQLQFSNASGTVLTNTSLEYLFVGAQ